MSVIYNVLYNDRAGAREGLWKVDRFNDLVAPAGSGISLNLDLLLDVGDSAYFKATWLTWEEKKRRERES